MTLLLPLLLCHGCVQNTLINFQGATAPCAGAQDGIVTAVEAGSPAAGAGLSVGDEIVAVDGAPLTSSKGRIATEALFGRKGSVVAVTARHNGVEKTVSLTLVAKR